MPLYYEQHGHGADLILLHGWGTRGRVWAPVLDALSHRYRITVIDLPGYGSSPARADSYTSEILAEEVKAVVPSPAIWVGWSMGGLIALTAAQKWPARVMGVVLVGTTPKFVWDADWPHGMAPELLAEFGTQLEKDYQATLTRFLSLQLGAGRPARLLLKWLRTEMLHAWEPTPEVLRAGLALLQQTDLRPWLREISQPLQFIHGDQDRLVQVETARAAVRELPNARLDVISGAGHIPFLSHTREFLGCVNAFLNDTFGY